MGNHRVVLRRSADDFLQLFRGPGKFQRTKDIIIRNVVVIPVDEGLKKIQDFVSHPGAFATCILNHNQILSFKSANVMTRAKRQMTVYDHVIAVCSFRSQKRQDTCSYIAR